MIRFIFIIKLILFITIFNSNLLAQSLDEIIAKPVLLYSSYNDLINNHPFVTGIKAEIKSEGQNHLHVKKFIYENNGERFNDILSIWAIKYKDEDYLLYGGEKKFIKFQLLGKYSIIVIDETIPPYFVGKPSASSPDNLIVQPVIGLAGGLMGMALYNEHAVQGIWKKENGTKADVLYIETDKRKKTKLLDKPKLKTFYPKDLITRDKIEKGNYTLEEILELFNRLNMDK